MPAIRLRRGSTSLWTSQNPTLGVGEVGIDTTLGKMKYGDGVTAWLSLPFFTVNPSELPPTPSVYNAGNVTGDITPDFANGDEQELVLTGATVARELNPPTNGVANQYLTLYIKSATGVSRTLAMDAAIVIPSDSGVSFPKTLGDDEEYIVKLQFRGGAWRLVTLIGGY